MTERNDFVQATRFLAAFIVVVTHVTFYIHERIVADFPIWHFGEVGVPIFFAISGYVIALSGRVGDDSAAVAAKLFLVRRIVRVVPLYWLATLIKIAIAIGVPGVVNHNHFHVDHAVKSLLFVPYFNDAGDIRPMHGVGWTLFHEVFFYLIFTLALWVRFLPPFFCVVTIVVLSVIGFFFNIESAAYKVATSPMNLYFVLGVVAALRLRYFWLVYIVHGGLFLGALAFAMFGWAESSVVCLFSLCFRLLEGSGLPSFLNIPIELGNSSYSLYLFHPLVAPTFVLLFGHYVGLPVVVVLAISVFCTILVCHQIHVFVERPLINKLRRWAADVF